MKRHRIYQNWLVWNFFSSLENDWDVRLGGLSASFFLRRCILEFNLLSKINNYLFLDGVIFPSSICYHQSSSIYIILLSHCDWINYFNNQAKSYKKFPKILSSVSGMIFPSFKLLSITKYSYHPTVILGKTTSTTK